LNKPLLRISVNSAHTDGHFILMRRTRADCVAHIPVESSMDTSSVSQPLILTFGEQSLGLMGFETEANCGLF
jgi:hypothetical protein